MNARKVSLIARHSTRHSVRGGVGLIFLLLSLTFGLLVAHFALMPLEMATKRASQETGNRPRAEVREQMLAVLVDTARPAAAWLLREGETGDAELDDGAVERSEDWADYLLLERPAMLSVIFLILLMGWPLIVACGAFDLYAGDISSRQLRYQLLRSDRGSIFAGRLLGSLVTFALVLLLLGVTITTYIAVKLPLYDTVELCCWTLYGVCALAIATLPYVALCAWISASFASSFGSLAIVSAVIGGTPLLAVLGRNYSEVAGYLNYLLPWGFQNHLFHPDFANVALAAGGCVLQTALFGWLGYRKFTRRDL